MAEIIVDYSETGNRFKKYQNSWNVEPGSGFPEAPRPAVGDVVTLTGYTVNPYTPTETASVQFHYVEEGGTRYLIEANTREGATPIYAAGVDDAIASGTVSFTITDVEEGDEVWIVSMVFGTPPIEEKALGGNAVTFFKEKIEGMVGDLSDLTTTDKTNLVAAINEAAAGGGGGGSATIFYKNSGLFGWGEDIEGPLFYKDSSYQTPATSSEMYAACMAGTTYICSNQSDDLFYTEIVAASNYSTNYNFSLANIEHVLGYDCTISSYISSGTEYYSFHYNEPVSINVVQTTGSSTTNVMSQNAVTTGLAGKQNTLTAGTGISINNNVISATSGGLVTLSYGYSTWNDFITAYNAGEIVYCRASSDSDPRVGSQTRMAFMAYVNNATNPTEVEFQYVRSVSTKNASNQSDQVFVYKLTNAGTWTVETRPVMVKIAAGTNAESSYASNTLTINPRLYTTTGQNTDGGVTQKLFTDTVGNIESALNLINNGGGN